MTNGESCTFCGKQRLSVLHLFVGPGGCNICDSCVSKGMKATGALVGSDHECSFCGRSARATDIVMAQGRSSICMECLRNCRDQMSQIVGGGPDFLAGGALGGSENAAVELMDMVRRFARQSHKFNETFRKGEIDWTAHNEMEQLLHLMRSKAGRLGDEGITELVWNIEQLFAEIHFDDVDANKNAIKRLADLVDRLLATTKKIIEG